MATPRRLLFGEVADLYDRHRPTYPAELADDLIALAGVGDGQRVLEVGAGTGKATQLFAARGVAVVAIEPSGGMAAVARRRFADAPWIEIVESDFERWDPAGETFPLLYAGQAWHWVDPAVRYQRARRALSAGGLLAVFWNRPAWGESALRDDLAAAYERIAPAMSTDGPLHPANPWPAGDEDWIAEIARVAEFSEAEVREYPWTASYDAPEFTGLLATLSEFRLLDADTRGRLLDAVAQAIAEHGGTLTMPMVARADLARAA
jgi:SAM-dependent methyltransferase